MKGEMGLGGWAQVVTVSSWLSVGSQCPHGCQWGHCGAVVSPWLSVGSLWGYAVPMAVSRITVFP